MDLFSLIYYQHYKLKTKYCEKESYILCSKPHTKGTHRTALFLEKKHGSSLLQFNNHLKQAKCSEKPQYLSILAKY